MQVNTFVRKTQVEGPGTRSCVWVQGCSIRCKDCANKHMWDFFAGTSFAVGELYSQLTHENDIEGITLLGGEPFDQATESGELAGLAQNDGLSVVTFTGYDLDHLIKMDKPGIMLLLESTDLLIDGPFIVGKKSFLMPWTGSSNQRYHFLTDRYRYLENYLENIPNRVECRISPDGSVRVHGIGDVDRLKKML